MKQEELIKILESGVDDGFIVGLTFDENRTFKFTVKLTDKEYILDWWCNICYLTTECGVYIPFDFIEIEGTWPNKYKNNIQLEYCGNQCAIIPVEEY